MSVLKSRSHFLNLQNNFTIPTKGLIKSWKIVGDIPGELFLGGIHLNTPRNDINVFDFNEIRGYIRDMDIQYDVSDVILTNLEATFYSYQLDAIQFYPSLDTDVFFNTLFTRDIKPIEFKFTEIPQNDIEIIEEYYDRTNENKNIRF
jgi:hypothetical protein